MQQQVNSIRLWRIAGGVAGIVGLAVAELGAGLIARDGSPVGDVATLLLRVLPAGLLRSLDPAVVQAVRIATIVLVVAAAIALSVVAGQLEFTKKHRSLLVYIPVGIFTLLAVSTQVGPGAIGYVPALLGLIASYITLRSLVTDLRRPPGALEPIVAERRNFLRTAGLVTLSGIVIAGAGRLLLQAANKAAEVRDLVTLPKAAHTGPAVPAGADFKVAGLTRYITPNSSFYRIDTALQVPTIDPATWTLKVTGMVKHEVSITYQELLARPLTEQVTTLTCMSNKVGGDLAGNASWLGLPVRYLLAEAGPLAGANMVLSKSQDGWTAGTPLTAMTSSELAALIAVGMNGEPLPAEHGFPARLVVPGIYGDLSATKWVTELKVTTFEEDEGYWPKQGWAKRGPVKIASRIDLPTRLVVDPGKVRLGGVAWAPPIGVSKVQVRIDDGPWRTAKLADTVGPDTWRQWQYTWSVSQPGTYQVSVRATDADGRVQTDRVSPPYPNGATGLQTVTIEVRQA